MKLFASDRYEDPGRPPFVATRAMRDTSETTKPLLILGDRGTGKTTLLRGLLWEESDRFAHPTEDALDRTAIAVYVKLSEHNFRAFEDWGIASNQLTLAAEWIRNYYELIFVGELLRTLDGLRRAGHLKWGPETEAAAVSRLLDGLRRDPGCPRGQLWDEELGDGAPSTLSDTASRLDSFKSSLRFHASLLSGSLTNYEFARPGEAWAICRSAVASLDPLLEHYSASHQTRILLCCDEFEACSVKEQQAMVELLVSYATPLVPILAATPSVSLPRTSRGQAAAAGHVFTPLPLGNENDFNDMAKSVVAARLGIDPTSREADSVSPSGILGTFQLNSILTAFVSSQAGGSETPTGGHRSAAALLAAATERPKPARTAADTASLPIFETYLDGVRGDLELGGGSYDTRHHRSTQYRKFQGVAALGVFGSFAKTRSSEGAAWFAGADIIAGICEFSIREYLRVLRHLADGLGIDSVEGFVARLSDGPFSITEQADAVRRASSERASLLHGATPQPGSYSSPTPALVDGLARLSHQLQVLPRWGSVGTPQRFPALSTPERGLFVLTGATSEGEAARYAGQALQEAVTAGWLVRDVHGPQIRYRVHRSLAAHYGFTYRRPQYTVPMSAEQIWTLLGTGTAEDREQWANNMASLHVRPQQEPLL